jgi:phage terminase large subunit GpA
MLSDAEIKEQIAATTEFGYALEYIRVDNRAFDFKDHEYLIELYRDTHPYLVIEKAAQMGASVKAMIKAFFVCDRLEKNVIYFFPTDEDVREFSKTRVAPIIQDSPHLREIVRASDADAVGVRRVGRGFLYFRGMKSQIRMKSVPGDMLVFDELDEVTEESEKLADKRLQHSTLKWRIKLSTPTFEGYGIDRDWQKSDQRYWNLICKTCGTWNILEKQFPDCWLRVDENRVIIICRKCKGQLDPSYGKWKAEAPSVTRIRGYHLCALYSKLADLSEFEYDYQEGRQLPEFFRSVLGIPYIDTNMRLTRSQVEACCGDYESYPEPHTYMGVDQKGRELHVVIRKPDKLSGRQKVLYIGTVTHFNDLSPLMGRFDVDLAVIDGLPNQHSAREWAQKHPGRVYLCYYSVNQKGDYIWKDPDRNAPQEDREWSVTVNRTEALDAMYEEITRRELLLPKLGPAVKDFAEHVTNLARVHETDDDGNILRATYKRLGTDHYAHAASYAVVAQTRFGGPTLAKTVLPRSAITRNSYARRWESGSRY